MRRCLPLSTFSIRRRRHVEVQVAVVNSPPELSALSVKGSPSNELKRCGIEVSITALSLIVPDDGAYDDGTAYHPDQIE